MCLRPDSRYAPILAHTHAPPIYSFTHTHPPTHTHTHTRTLSTRLQVDNWALRTFVSDGHQVALCQSFAKNFGLYGRVCDCVCVCVCDCDVYMSVCDCVMYVFVGVFVCVFV